MLVSPSCVKHGVYVVNLLQQHILVSFISIILEVLTIGLYSIDFVICVILPTWLAAKKITGKGTLG